MRGREDISLPPEKYVQLRGCIETIADRFNAGKEHLIFRDCVVKYSLREIRILLLIRIMDDLKINKKLKVTSPSPNCSARNDDSDCEEEEAKRQLNDSDNDCVPITRDVSKSMNQHNHILEEYQRKPRSTHLSIDISSCLPRDNSDNLQSSPNKSLVKKFDDANRRAKIFDSCKVNSPSFLAESPSNMASNKLYYPSITEKLEELKNEGGDKFSSFTSQQSTIPDLFQFPHRPIEQMTLLNNEVELERQSAKRKQTIKTNSSPDYVKDSFDTRIEPSSEKKRRLSPPEFDKLNFEGENVSGVMYFVLVSRLS